MKPHFDDRNRQGKALVKWQLQQQRWKTMEEQLAKKVGKDPSQTLPGSIHHFRMAQEELGMIDAAVPAEVKNGISAWEMNLRSGAGGVRYVQIGSSYPYPLYCPIRDAEQVKSDNNILMRVIPNSVPLRHKPVSEGEYFRDRQAVYKKHIKKKFAHILGNSAEPLDVIGSKPPVTEVQLKEDEKLIEPIVFVPYEKPEPVTSIKPVTPIDEVVVPTEKPPSRPLSAVIGSQKPVTTPAAQEGPMLMFSTAHLSFTAAPNEPAQAAVRVDNIGSTAVFYSWVPLETDSVVPEQNKRNLTECFRLSAPQNGVFLPEDEVHFTFCFRSAAPGVYTQQYELLTVPAGKERIILHLRGVVFSVDGDPVATHQLDTTMVGKAPKDDVRNMFTEILSSEVSNVLDEAYVQLMVKDRAREEQERKDAVIDLQATRQKAWNLHNEVLNLGFNEHVYDKIHQLYARYHHFLKYLNPEHQVNPEQAEMPEGSPVEWNGSIRTFLEDLTIIKDAQLHVSYHNALSTLMKAASVVKEHYPKDTKTPLKTLLMKTSSLQAWQNCVDDLHVAALAAKEISEGRGVLKATVGKSEKDKKKDAAKTGESFR